MNDAFIDRLFSLLGINKYIDCKEIYSLIIKVVLVYFSNYIFVNNWATETCLICDAI